MIASDFLYGIGRLVRSQELDEQSPFVIAAQITLTTFVDSQITDGWPTLVFLNRAKGDLELSIATAMKLSLQ